MARSLADRLSPALVISVTALFVSLGGASYAALVLPANAVGRRQLRTGAVTRKKIATGAVTSRTLARRAVTASKVNVAGFATVPRARRADSATTATSAANATNAANAHHADSATTATTARHADTATTATTATNATELGSRAAGAYALARTLQPTSAFLENGWFPTNGFGVPGYARDPFGIVHLFGYASHSSPSAMAIFTLPAGFRPAYDVNAVVFTGGGAVGYVQIQPTGDVVPGGSLGAADLEGVTFSTSG